MPQAHSHPRFLNRQDTTEQRVGSSSDSDDAAYCLGFLAEPAVFLLSAFPDGPQLQDTSAEQHHALLDTGQCCHLANSSTSCVHISRPQHSVVGNTDNPGAAEAANPSALDNSDADYSDSSRVTSGKPAHDTNAIST
jgi:hypothetical protein